MEPLYQRKSNVDYFEKDANTWKVVSHLTDHEHDIAAEIAISVPEMIIKDAVIKFNRYPLDECLSVEPKANQLIGISIMKEYRKSAYQLFLGPQGCPNVMNLLSSSIPGFIFIYYPHLIKTGQMKPEEWVNIIRTDLANDCLAHTLMNQKFNWQGGTNHEF
jgi:Protein of unknown function (DUF2889).